MAIRFNCDCGQTITARSDFAGRKVQCVACKKILVVPGERKTTTSSRPSMPTSSAAPPPAPASPSSPTKIRPRATEETPPPNPVHDDVVDFDPMLEMAQEQTLEPEVEPEPA